MNNIAKPIYRLVAGLIDFLIISIPSIYILHWFSFSEDYVQALDKVFALIFSLLVYVLLKMFFEAFMISKFGGTIGKLLTGTRIVTSDTKTPTFWRAFFRNRMGYFVSSVLLWFGFIWILVDKERRAWHDMMADTYVVLVNKSIIVLGVLVLIVVSWFNFYLIKSSITNFSTNAAVYSELLNLSNLQEELSKELQ